jgi:TPR repeat protein
VVIRRQLKRRSVLAFFQKLPPCLVGIEACASSQPWRAIAIATVIGLLLTAALLGYSQGIIPWIGPSGQQQSSKTNDATIAALPNSNAARKVEETRRKAEADAKVADDAAKKKAEEEGRQKAEAKAADDAARKKTAGVAQDAASRVGYEKAAALGNTNAMVDLGIMYENGRGVSRDFEQARKWYEQAAALGNAAAMYNLGLLYQNALRDSAQARKWYEKAAALGDATALTNFLSLCWRGYGVSDSDLPSCYGTAAGFGSVNAMFNLGLLYENKDTDQARKWYQKAADAGYEPAKEKLKTLK